MSRSRKLRRGRPLDRTAPESVRSAESSVGDLGAICEAYVIAVVTESAVSDIDEPKRSRRIYLSLHSASKAVQRAELRGQRASLILCRLVPVQGDLESAGWSE